MKYRFYLVTEDGNVMVWTNLTYTQAKALNKATYESYNSNASSAGVTRFGWEVMA